MMSKTWMNQNVGCVNLNIHLNHFGPSLSNNIVNLRPVILPFQNYIFEKSQKDQSSRQNLISNNQLHNSLNRRII